MANLADALDHRFAGSGVRHFDRHKRSQQLEFSLLELRLQHSGVGREESVGSEFSARVSGLHHFIKHLFVGLLPGRPRIVEHAPAVRRASEQKPFFQSLHRLSLHPYFRITVANMSKTVTAKAPAPPLMIPARWPAPSLHSPRATRTGASQTRRADSASCNAPSAACWVHKPRVLRRPLPGCVHFLRRDGDG